MKDINLKVSDASKNLRIERVRLIKLKVKEVLGKDVHISIKDVNTDVKVERNLNDLHRTAGIVSNKEFICVKEYLAVKSNKQHEFSENIMLLNVLCLVFILNITILISGSCTFINIK